MIDEAETAFQNMGYNQIKTNFNTQVDARDWVDSRARSWGKDYVDPYGTDFADVAMYTGHGGRVCNQNGNKYYSTISMGDNNGDEDTYCSVSTNDMSFGNGGSGEETKIALLYACQSMHYSGAH